MPNNKLKRWRVRVRRSVDDWVEVMADDRLQAEAVAASMPFVLSVFGGSAIPANKAVDQIPPVGVEDE
jgi:hypothetical protein